MESLIYQGTITPGARLSLRKLMQEFGVSKNTVERALAQLKDNGIVNTVPKSGTFVTKDAWRLVATDRTPDWQRISMLGHHKASDDLVDAARKRQFEPEGMEYRHMFAFNEVDFNPYEHVRKAVLEADHDEIVRTLSSQNLNMLEEQAVVAEHVKRYGIRTEPENVLLFNNILGAISAIVFSLFRRGSNLYRMHPDYMGSTELFSTVGSNKHWLRWDEEGIRPEDLSRKVVNARHNVLSVNPVNHFPTGVTMTEKRIGELLKICQKHRVPVIENDMLRNLWLEEPPPPMKSADKYEQVIYIGSLDMTMFNGYGGAWVIAPKCVVKRLFDIRFQMYGRVNSMTNFMLKKVLTSGTFLKDMERVRGINARRVPVVRAMLEKYFTGIARWYPDRIQYHLMLKFDSRVNTERLFRDCSNISFIPGSCYHDSSVIVMNTVCESLECLERALSIVSYNAKRQISAQM